MRKSLLFVLALSAVLPLQAQTLPAELVLPQFLDMVRTRSPQLSIERSLIDTAQADLLAARALPNPEVSYSYTRLTRETESTISQAIPIFGQREQRIRSGERGVEAAQAQVRVVYTDLLRDAARDFHSLQIAQEREALWRSAHEDLEVARKIVQGQVEAGARSRYDLARIEVEQSLFNTQLGQAQAETEGIRSQLAIAIGETVWRPQVLGSIDVDWRRRTFEQMWPEAQARLPALRAALAEEAFSESRVDVEKREAFPIPSFEFGTTRGEDSRQNRIGISLPIPLFDRNQGAIARAQVDARNARLRRQLNVRIAENALRRALDQLARRGQIAERFEQDGLRRLPQLRQMAEDAYRLGQGGILELIDAIQSTAEKRSTYLELQEALLHAELDVKVATGELGAQGY
jgi:cobalt-zinc-cadmium efflux system outer membrane protein